MMLEITDERFSFSVFAVVICMILACSKDPVQVTMIPQFGPFSNEQPVQIKGYSGHAMEPFISRDGRTLFFNNSGKNGANMNIHYCDRVSDNLFQYKGELSGINTEELEGVPTMDKDFTMYFTTMRSYRQDLHSIYTSQFMGNKVSIPVPADHQLKHDELGWIIFDSEITENGQTLYYAMGKYVNESFPRQADLHIATKSDGTFNKKNNSEELLIQVNSDLLEYAPAISNDELELFFTRANINKNPPEMTIWMCSRSNVESPFGRPIRIEAIQGIFTEGPSITSDCTKLYYHKMNNGQFELFMVTRKKN